MSIDQRAATTPPPDPAHGLLPEGTETAIRCRGLWKVFGPRPERIVGSPDADLSRVELLERTGCVVACQEVTFDVGVGEIFVVMGLSGSGKSTLVRCLSRLIEPTAGSVEIAGGSLLDADAAQLRELRRHTISMVFQHFGLLPNRNVRDNIAYGLEIQGVDRATRRGKAEEVIELVGLQGFADRFPDELSGGMKQRVGLARALANDPDILLLDEPFSALDPLIRAEMQEEAIRLQRELGVTMVFITHDLQEALRLGDRVAVMRDGEVVQIGTAAQLLERPADHYVRDFTKEVPRALVLTAGDIATPTDEARPGTTPALEVEATTLLRDCIPAIAGDRPITVTDDGRIVGSLEPQAVLAAIYGGSLPDPS
ncbi:ATP-binding cassette domain-containing protein [Egibacter rhizosphaerae]|uniref:ATP-binding cassette domain-containing protein n=1 Tax=Egibacter rhizosphaerae TaxID=1670831 RepID=A0A411YDP8_9ACTN|nr:betaine/proline/choline family ABC transporter ATP-binding protein [Egibacter rhizosphaerae]QBI19310.1 ATP-binding cassette domain-containing protein [Egibacter rhizosphaerae]